MGTMNVLRGAKNYVTGALGFSSGETRYDPRRPALQRARVLDSKHQVVYPFLRWFVPARLRCQDSRESQPRNTCNTVLLLSCGELRAAHRLCG